MFSLKITKLIWNIPDSFRKISKFCRHSAAKKKLMYTVMPVNRTDLLPTKPHCIDFILCFISMFLPTTGVVYQCIFIELICRPGGGVMVDKKRLELHQESTGNSSRLIDSVISACFRWHRIDGFSPAPPPHATYLYALDEALLNYLSQSVIKCAMLCFNNR